MRPLSPWRSARTVIDRLRSDKAAVIEAVEQGVEVGNIADITAQCVSD